MCFLVLPRNWEGTKICKHWLDWILVKQVWDCLGILLICSPPTRGILAQQLQWKIGLAPCNTTMTNHPGPPVTYHLSDLHHKRYLLDLFGTCFIWVGSISLMSVTFWKGRSPPHPTWWWYRTLRPKVIVFVDVGPKQQQAQLDSVTSSSLRRGRDMWGSDLEAQNLPNHRV